MERPFVAVGDGASQVIVLPNARAVAIPQLQTLAIESHHFGMVSTEPQAAVGVVQASVFVLAAGSQGTQGIQGGKGDTGERGPPGQGSSAQDNFVANAQILSDRSVPLEGTPADPLKVELVIYGGPEQRPAVDFVVTGNILSWEGLALELLLESGSSFSVRYIT